MAAKQCQGVTKKGNACKSSGVLDNGYCIAHQPSEVRESLGFGGPQEGSGRPRKPNAAEFLREWWEEHEGELLGVLAKALTAEKAIVVATKDHAEIEFVPDYDLQLKAFKEALDRVYGRPRQATEISGPAGGPIRIDGDVDLSRLLPEQLETLRGLLADAAPE